MDRDTGREMPSWSRASHVATFAGGLAATIAQACGGSDAAISSTDPTDGGGGEAAPMQAGPPDSATCDLSSNLLDRIPDASIADGQSTTGVCLGCAQAACGDKIAACNTNCTCKDIAGGVLDCYARTSSAISCGGALISAPPTAQTIGLALFSCVSSTCKEECAPKDAGK